VSRNLGGPEGTRAALMATVPLGAGALIGPDGGSPLGLVGDGVRAPVGHGAGIDQALAGLDARVTALEAGEAGEGMAS
jgi:hypothetical protein